MLKPLHRRTAHRPETLGKSAAIFAALGDETRMRLVTQLCAGGMLSITQLTSRTEVTRQAVTKHLKVLADAGLVRDQRVGRERRWELVPDQIEEARRTLEMIGQKWDEALDRLKMAVEDYPAT